MVIDNDVYNRQADAWWDEDNPLNMLNGSVTPARMAYFREVLVDRIGRDPVGLRTLDIGCGGGFLAEEFARLGCDVVGVDPSADSLRTAGEHATRSNLTIEYRVGAGEALPVDDGEFDLVYCCDVLEHVDDLAAVMSETARAIAPGGVYLFDTVNRTFASKLIAIKVVQEWRLTRVVDTPIHDWALFITPAELQSLLARQGLSVRETVGLGPRVRNPAAILLGLIGVKRRRLSYGELSRRLNYGKVTSTSVSYMGYATADA